MILSTQEAHDVSDLVKTGRSGRVYFSAEQKQHILALFAQSGMSGKAFATNYGVKYSTFARWRRQESATKSIKKSNNSGFVLAEVEPHKSESLGLSLELPCGAKVHARGDDGVELLAQLIQRLR